MTLPMRTPKYFTCDSVGKPQSLKKECELAFENFGRFAKVQLETGHFPKVVHGIWNVL